MPTLGVAQTVNGGRIYVDLDDERGRTLVQTEGNFNPNSLALWNVALSVHPWSLVVDVGANYGEMLVGARLPAGITIKAYEPNSAIRGYLSQTISDAGLEVEIYPLAVGAESGTAAFAVDSEWSGTSKLVGDGETTGSRWRHEEVEVTTLDHIVGQGEQPCIKVDVEGFELDVLEGAKRLLHSNTPWAIVLEILHMTEFEVARLAEQYPMYVIDTRTHKLIRVAGGNPHTVRRLLQTSGIYRQDALLVHRTLVDIGAYSS